MANTSSKNNANLFEVSVSVAGFPHPVTVLISHDRTELPRGMAVLAPDTRHVEVFAAIRRSANVYGSLTDEFFVCRDSDFEYNWTVLWVTQNAEQAQDNVQRLEPFCMLHANWQRHDTENDGLDSLGLEGMILLWAYAQYATGAWGKEFLDNVRVSGGLLDAHVAGLVVRAGASGSTLDLSWVGKEQS